MSSRLEQFQKRKQILDAKIKALEEKDLAKQRKAQDRRKFLVGESLLSLVERGDLSQDWLDQILEDTLVRKNDRALFGLPVKDVEL
jgi:hypothetical protein